ncbi:unnamed protein product [Hermetia illucens]|uniref:Uncharacterized protein n=1 Tax=Hermetia illucens TaxID=343691 RepID=A0A7R8UI54_HERIL|nr:uncharacterized protein LOC119647437 [Hermetia illucens]CAD7081130.1 unnamed protein product [Hermetia illucens]
MVFAPDFWEIGRRAESRRTHFTFSIYIIFHFREKLLLIGDYMPSKNSRPNSQWLSSSNKLPSARSFLRFHVKTVHTRRSSAANLVDVMQGEDFSRSQNDLFHPKNRENQEISRMRVVMTSTLALD